MTNHKKIKFLLEMGVYKGVEVCNLDIFQKKVTFVRMQGDTLFTVNAHIYTEEDINDMTITSITPIPNPPKLLPVGTKVRVFEEYASNMPFDYVITQSDDACYTIEIFEFGKDGNSMFVPARAVVPVLD